MAIQSNHNGWNVADATELKLAVEAKLLTQEEARRVYWSQFTQLAQVASNTPPPIEEVA